MSKPTYAAVAAPSTTNKQQPPSDQPQQAGEAPPPCPSQSNTTPHHAHFASPPQQSFHSHQSYHSANNVEGQQIVHPTGGWSPPPNLAVARSRASRRFWGAFLWAWAIWIIVGLLVGGGVSDIERNPPGRHGHWGKHGRWHGDDVTIYPIETRELEVPDAVQDVAQE